MYLDTDIILALIKKEDWLKEHVRLSHFMPAKTSVIAVIEARIVLLREYSREKALETLSKIKKLKIEIVPLNVKILEQSQILLEKYSRLGIFDSIHIATAIVYGEKLVSTDKVFYEIEELENIDPRDFKNGKLV